MGSDIFVVKNCDVWIEVWKVAIWKVKTKYHDRNVFPRFRSLNIIDRSTLAPKISTSIWKFEPSSNEPSQFQFDSIIESEPDDWIEICRIKDFGNHIIWPKDFINVNIETNKIPNWNTLVYIKMFSHLSMALMILNSFDRPHWTILFWLNLQIFAKIWAFGRFWEE